MERAEERKQQAVEERSKRLCKFSALLNFRDYLQEVLSENIGDASGKVFKA